MKKLETIKIQNFKIFNQEIIIPVEGKNLLAWGVNGSGKSSMYWALYTFLQCSAKSTDEAKKYFNQSEESLHNIHAKEGLESFIKLGFKEQSGDEENFELSLANNETNSDYIRSINSGSEFVTHRLLLNFYNYRNSQKIDLFPVFFRDIFPYFNTPKGNNFRALYKTIEEKLNSETKPNLDKLAKEFNDGLEDLIQPIKRGEATKFYNDNLSYKEEKIDLKILFPKDLRIEGNKPNRRLINPKINLSAKLKARGTDEKNIIRPQSFFNEARINAIALSIRFVLMANRTPVDTVKFLVLDDLLISLDMQNRVKVIKLILKEFKDKYQVMIFTHDKGFYKEMLRQIESDKHNWKVMQFYEPRNTGENPVIEFEDDTYLARANAAFLRRDYEACALYLRKETEAILVSFLDPEMEKFWKNKDWISLADFITRTKNQLDTFSTNDFTRFVNQGITKDELEILKNDLGSPDETTESKELIGKLSTYRRRLFDFIIDEKDNRANAVYPLIDEINKIKDRVLNPSAHAGESPFFEEEIEDAISKVKELKVKLDEIITGV
jgi:hypothetical protein